MLKQMKSLFKYIALAAVICSSCIKERETGASLVVGDDIPDFSVTMNDGAQITGEYLREGVCCIVFFTTACSDCRKTLPHIQRVYDEYLPLGVRFALISREEKGEDIEKFWADQGLTMPYSAQEDNVVYKMFAKTRVPRVYICRDGVIKFIFTDSPNPTYEDMKAAIIGI